MNIGNKNYITILGWMRSVLDLKGNELLLYALIHGFCQSEDHTFHGTVSLMSEWIGATSRTVTTTLQSLVSKGLLERSEIVVHGVRVSEYRTLVPDVLMDENADAGTFSGGEKFSPLPEKSSARDEKISPNNNSNNNIIGVVSSHSYSSYSSDYKSGIEGKDSIPNNRIGFYTDNDKKTNNSIYETIKDLYNELCPSLPKCYKLTDARKKAVKARMQEGFTADDFAEAFRKAEASDFCKGKNSRGWKASFDFATGPHIVDLLEGKYDKQNTDSGSGTSTVPEYTDEEIERLWRLEGEEEEE